MRVRSPANNVQKRMAAWYDGRTDRSGTVLLYYCLYF